MVDNCVFEISNGKKMTTYWQLLLVLLQKAQTGGRGRLDNAPSVSSPLHAVSHLMPCRSPFQI